MSLLNVRLFVEQKLSSKANIDLNYEQSHYISKVMHSHVKQQILVFNEEDGEWLTEIIKIAPKKVTLYIEKQTILPQKKDYEVILCFALLKNKGSNVIVQKASELGVTLLQPIITERTNVHKINQVRLKKIAIEASEQCERVDIANIKEPMSINNLVNTWNQDIPIIMADESGKSPPITEKLREIKSKSFAIMIGPEGGFTDNERSMLISKEFVIPVDMGKRIMRADTAAIAALSCCQSTIGDWFI